MYMCVYAVIAIMITVVIKFPTSQIP